MFCHIRNADLDISSFVVHFKEQSPCFALIRKKKKKRFLSDRETALEEMSGIRFHQIKFAVIHRELKVNL